MNGRVILMGGGRRVGPGRRREFGEGRRACRRREGRGRESDGARGQMGRTRPAGPKAVAKKTVVYVAGDMRNGGILGVAHGLKEASDVIWAGPIARSTARAPSRGRLRRLSQAIALKPDAIVVGGSDAVQQKAGLDEAAKQGIVIVGWHAGPKPGRWMARRCSPM